VLQPLSPGRRLSPRSRHDRAPGRGDRVPLELLVGKEVEVPHQDVDLASADEVEMLVAEQRGELVVAHRGGVRESLFDEAVRAEPVGRPPVKLPHRLRSGGPELDTQELAEEMVVAVPVPTTVERYEEQVRSLEVRKASPGIRRTENGVARLRREPVEDGRSQQEVPLVVVNSLQH